MARKTETPAPDTDDLDFLAVLDMLNKLKRGDFSARLPDRYLGVEGKVADALNDLAEIHSILASEVSQTSAAVRAGRLSERMPRSLRKGEWSGIIADINSMTDTLVAHAKGMVEVVGAVSHGDLSERIASQGDAAHLEGDFLKHGKIVDGMVERLQRTVTDVSHLARDIGREGLLDGKIDTAGAPGVWRSLADDMNTLTRNLSGQVQSITGFVNAVTDGALSKPAPLDAPGDLGALPAAISQMAQTLSGQVRSIADGAAAVTNGNFNQFVQIEVSGELAELRDNVNNLIAALAKSKVMNEQQNLLKTNLATFAKMLRGERDLDVLAQNSMIELARVVDAQHGAFYLAEKMQDETVLRLAGTYAYRKPEGVSDKIRLGEGLVGQCALEKRLIDVRSVPRDYIQIQSGLGEMAPGTILVWPVLYEDDLKAVVEIASLGDFTAIERGFLEQFFETLGAIIANIEAGQRTEALLKQSQGLTEELRAQQEALRQSNENLEDKAREILQQNREVERKNAQVETARNALEKQAGELELTSKYKSEFLANMSHELRTPLNSVLILSQQLAANPDKNLTESQIEHARIIYSSGRDLLSLIDEVLDMAKIESGTMTIRMSDVELQGIAQSLGQNFRAIAAEKDLDFEIAFAEDLPSTICTDEKRLLQILKNLLSNAFKFTESGTVTVTAERAYDGWPRSADERFTPGEVVAFSVTDTGIGIDPERHRMIFEAFHQAESNTKRRFSGTGLGLSISREIANFISGEITMESSVGQGSTFTLYLPEAPHSSALQAQPRPSGLNGEHLLEDSAFTAPAPSHCDRKLLIIDSDAYFASAVTRVARDLGMETLIAATSEDGIAMAAKQAPDAILLDTDLKEADGLTTIDLLKHTPELQHIPIYAFATEANFRQALHLGALDVRAKPSNREVLATLIRRIAGFVDRSERRLLICHKPGPSRRSVAEIVGNGDVRSVEVDDQAAVLEALQSGIYDCIVLDLDLELIRKIRSDDSYATIPIVIYSDTDMTDDVAEEIEALSASAPISHVNTSERLFSDTALYLHREVSKLPTKNQIILRELRRMDAKLAGKTALIVDDDARNVVATDSLLTLYHMKVLRAESGMEGIELLKSTQDIDVVLMDIMMPEMDGYEAIRAIREMDGFNDIPIIALTAKAMPEDRGKCIEAGASDYIMKPIDTEKLASLLRVRL